MINNVIYDAIKAVEGEPKEAHWIFNDQNTEISLLECWGLGVSIKDKDGKVITFLPGKTLNASAAHADFYIGQL